MSWVNSVVSVQEESTRKTMFEQTENLLKRAAISERWPVWSPKHVHKADRASNFKEKTARGNVATSANHNNIG